MAIEIKVPVLPESVADATMLDWHKQPGDSVRRDENLVDIETDKVVLEVPCPVDGVLTSVSRNSGDTVLSGEVIGIFEPGDIAEQATPVESNGVASDIPSLASDPQPAPAKPDADMHGPAVRNLLASHGLNPSDIEGSGKDGRILKEDVQRHFENQVAPATGPSTGTAPDVKTPESVRRATTVATARAPAGTRSVRREPMSRLRRTIARRLVESQQNAALLTTFNEVDMTEVLALRKRYKESFVDRHGVKLGFMSFFVKASVEALQQFPGVNAYVEEDEIIFHDYQDVGIAVSSPRGLVVPIIRNAETLGFAALEKQISQFGERATSGDLALDELTGGTFTISNGGVFGSLLSTPIINPPQSGILGMHRIEQRAMVIDGEIVARPMMYLALSYDHRIVDGREAVQFLVTIKNGIEDPTRLMLEV